MISIHHGCGLYSTALQQLCNQIIRFHWWPWVLNLPRKPPPTRSSDAPHIGWRTEFRSMEIQPTDFENAAFTAFMVPRNLMAFGQRRKFLRVQQVQFGLYHFYCIYCVCIYITSTIGLRFYTMSLACITTYTLNTSRVKKDVYRLEKMDK